MVEASIKKDGTTYSKDFSQFYRDVVWWGDDYAPDTFDKNAFLVQMLGRSPRDVIEHAQKVFGFTGEDFRAALYDAPPGIVMYEEKWVALNKKYGIDPPLPFPRPAWVLKAIEEEKGK